MNVIEYVTEEVKRQGHNILTLDGIERVGWMLNGWSHALDAMCRGQKKPSVRDAINLGILIEPTKNINGIRTCWVRVGSRICPPAIEVPSLLNTLFDHNHSPLRFYKEYELIHPFVDGNGRSGKILLNWLNETLLDPVFPPNDLWGEPINNP